MSITSVARTRYSYSLSREGIQTFEETWLAESDQLYETPGTVLAAGALGLRPWYGAHPDDSALKLRDKKVSQTGDLNIYEVTLSYSDEFEPFDRTLQPSLRPWHMDWTSASTERLLEQDFTTPTRLDVCNSVGIPYDPPPSVPEAQAQLNVTFFNEIAQPDKIAIYVNAVNDDTFLDFPADLVRCTAYEQTQISEQLWGIIYQYKLTFLLKEDGWNPIRILDAGTMKKIPVGPLFVLAACQDRLGNYVTSPVPLDGAGGQLTLGLPFVYRSFTGYRREDFSLIS